MGTYKRKFVLVICFAFTRFLYKAATINGTFPGVNKLLKLKALTISKSSRLLGLVDV